MMEPLPIEIPRTAGAMITPEQRTAMGTGLMIATTALTSYVVLLALELSYHNLPNWLPPAVVVAFAFISGFTLLGRAAIADLWTTMEHKSRMVAVVALGAVFILAGSLGGRQPFIGFAALHLPLLLCLVSPRGYAWYYFVAGTTVGTALLHFQMEGAMVIGGVGLCLLLLTLAYENFFFTLEDNPAATRVSALLPLWLAIKRALLCAAFTAPVLWFTPLPQPFLRRESPNPPAATPRLDSDKFNLDLVKAALYTGALFLLLLGLLALLRYLRNKLRRKQSEVLPESIGVPVASARLAPTRAAEEYLDTPRTPREKIVNLYRQFGQGLRSPKARRHPAQTPAEYAEILENRGALTRDQVREITSLFIAARYDQVEPDWEQAQRFEDLTSKALSSSRAEEDFE